jgi:hypothetical protein
MDKRSVALTATLGFILAIAVFNLQSNSAAVLLVFSWLLPMLAVSAAVLWAAPFGDGFAELRLKQPNCGDPVESKPQLPPSPDGRGQISGS